MSVRLTYDPEHNVARILLREGTAASTEEVAPGVLMDVADDGQPVAFEFLNARKVFGGPPQGVEFIIQSVAGLIGR